MIAYENVCKQRPILLSTFYGRYINITIKQFILL